MAKLRPFRALQPNSENASRLASVPYDVVNRDEAAKLAQGNPISFLRVSRPELELAPDTQPYSDTVYERARTNLEKLIRECPMKTDETPALFIYRLQQGKHEQVGIAATYSIDEYENGVIKRHELTRKDKEDDRTRHVLTLKAQTGPVYLAYPGTAEINAWVSRKIAADKPLYDFRAEDGVTHTLWRIDQTDSLTQAFALVKNLYIADGHHRAASAARARAELRAANPRHRGDEDYNFFLAVAFPSEQLRILAYNRVLKDLNGMTPASLLEKLKPTFQISETLQIVPPAGLFAMYLERKWYELKPLSPIPQTDPLAKLDVSILQNLILAPLFGIQDPRTDKRIDFVGGIRGTEGLVSLVDSGQAKVAFSLHATSLNELMAVTDRDQIMPPKSTWFEPKLRDGLLSHWIENPK